jgi:hypothetical protein
LPDLRLLDQALLRQLAGMSDPLGVATVLAGSDAGSAIALRARLDRLAETVDDARASEALASLATPHAVPAWGAAVALSTGVRVDFALPESVPFVAEIAPAVRLIPIARAYDAHRPVGVVDVHLDHARIIEAAVQPVALSEVPLLPARRSTWAEHDAPAAANPQRGYRRSPQRGRYEHRVAANRERTLRELSTSLGQLARRRGWRSLLVAGEPDLTRELLPRHPAVLRLNRALPAWRSPDGVLDGLQQALAEARELAVASLSEAAETRPRGFARGLAASAEALAQRRARALVLDGPLDDPIAETLVRDALAQRVPVLFAHGELWALHGAICELHG